MPFVIEAIGYVGSLFAVVTYWMKEMLPLRIAALLSCVFFIAYAAMIGSWPLLLMEFVSCRSTLSGCLNSEGRDPPRRRT